MSKKKIITGVILAAVVIVFIAVATLNVGRQEDATGIARNAVTVQWAHPQRQTIINSVNARGTVELVERTVVFPETQAQAIRVYVQPGDIVEEGAILISYDDDTLDTLHDRLEEARLSLRSARLGLEAARIGPASTEILSAENQIEQARGNITGIELQLAQADLGISQIEESIAQAQDIANNIAALFENGVVSRAEMDTANDNLRRLQDQLATAQSQREATAVGLPLAQESERLAAAQLEAIRNRANQPAAQNQAQLQQVAIEQAELRIEQIEREINNFVSYEIAPVAGTVLSVGIREGEFSAAGRPIAEIADTSNLVITVYVPENEAGSVILGQQAEISGGALGAEIIMGSITRIHPVAAPRQIGNIVETVLTVEITPEAIGLLRPGLTVDADIILSVSENTMVVPLMATISEGANRNYVYLVGEDYTARRMEIELGAHSGIFIEVTGLDDDAMVISNVGPQIREGVAIRPVAQENREQP